MSSLESMSVQGLRFPFRRPVATVLPLHAHHELIDRDVPIDFVGVRDEEGRNGDFPTFDI